MNRHTKGDLKQMQSLPLSAKIKMTERRIRDWYDYWNGQVYVSFSGGKDSTVLLHIARKLFPDIEAVFVNTGLEYPEIRQFVKTFDNVTILSPKMRFDEVIKKYGYPMISKEVAYKVDLSIRGGISKDDFIEGTERERRCGGRYSLVRYAPLLNADFRISNYCCNVMKKKPAKSFEKKTGKKAILATMASESLNREQAWLRTGCNAFDRERPQSKPMSFWTEQDVLGYIKENNIPIASVYGEVVYAEQPNQMRIEDYGLDECGTEKLKTTGCDRTGCIFCGFGCHIEKSPSRFERLKETHPRQYEYCIGGGEYDENGVWKPNKKGLGMRHIFEELNKIYGEGFIKF